MKPLLSYYGGKQRMAQRILKLFPRHSVYVEPFCGGATLLFAKPAPDYSLFDNNYYKEVLNDKLSILIKFYEVAKTQPDELLKLIESRCFAEDWYRLSTQIVKNPESFNDIEIAWAVWYQCNFSFAKQMRAGFASGKKGRNFPLTKLNLQSRFLETCARLDQITIHNRDALEIIKMYDRYETLFYLDPPYVNTDQGHYKGYTEKDLKDLIELLESCKCSFVMSGYPNTLVPSEWVKHEFIMDCSVPNKVVYKKKTEVVWVRDNSHLADQEELSKVRFIGCKNNVIKTKQLNIFEK